MKWEDKGEMGRARSIESRGQDERTDTVKKGWRLHAWREKFRGLRWCPELKARRISWAFFTSSSARWLDPAKMVRIRMGFSELDLSEPVRIF
jgi:hypothetical protein